MSGLTLFNTLGRKKEPFSPLNPGSAGIYTCGPTVYQYATIGNFRSYIFADILRRSLEYEGFEVTHVMNITDVGHLVSDADEGEDKMVTGAKRLQKTPEEIAEMYTKDFFESFEKLNILRPGIECKATEHIDEMIDFVAQLEERGFTYQITDGIYFSVEKFIGYGKLSGLRLENQKSGARIEVNPEKRHPADFALWKIAEPGHIMKWESPWGVGYPGWHIECSAMGLHYLGKEFDIHTGGVDHIPVHHENEIAQNEALLGHPAARIWMHGEFLQIDGGKMSKSLGNFYRIKDLEERGLGGLAYRYFCLTGHYRSQLNFTWQGVTSAANAFERMRNQVAGLRAREDQSLPEADHDELVNLQQEFREAIRDDLNMPRALAVVWKTIKSARSGRKGYYPILADFDRILGLRFDSAKEKSNEVDGLEIPGEVSELLQQRETARAEQNWQAADALRDRILELGFSIRDSREGPILEPVT